MPGPWLDNTVGWGIVLIAQAAGSIPSQHMRRDQPMNAQIGGTTKMDVFPLKSWWAGRCIVRVSGMGWEG